MLNCNDCSGPRGRAGCGGRSIQPSSLPSMTRRAHIPPSATCTWATPQKLFNRLNREFDFTVDVAASRSNAKCRRFYTARQNGLSKDWSGETVWCNPPYGRVIAEWMQKAYLSSRRGATVVLLVPARTDTAWFRDYALRGAARCGSSAGGSSSGAPRTRRRSPASWSSSGRRGRGCGGRRSAATIQFRAGLSREARLCVSAMKVRLFRRFFALSGNECFTRLDRLNPTLVAP